MRAASKLAANSAEIQREIQAVDGVDARLNVYLHTTPKWEQLKAGCHEWIKQEQGLLATEAFGRDTQVISDALAFTASFSYDDEKTLDEQFQDQNRNQWLVTDSATGPYVGALTPAASLARSSEMGDSV